MEKQQGDRTIARALKILESRLSYEGTAMGNPAVTKNYLICKMSELKSEVFGMLMLDSQHRVIKSADLFTGTIDGASVYPREVVRAVIEANAAAVILYHNHPSGVTDPSLADRQITHRLIDALALIDVRVLDHVIVGGTTTVSFAERGLI